MKARPLSGGQGYLVVLTAQYRNVKALQNLSRLDTEFLGEGRARHAEVTKGAHHVTAQIPGTHEQLPCSFAKRMSSDNPGHVIDCADRIAQSQAGLCPAFE